jgi:hypothetical protein
MLVHSASSQWIQFNHSAVLPAAATTASLSLIAADVTWTDWLTDSMHTCVVHQSSRPVLLRPKQVCAVLYSLCTCFPVCST